MEAMRVSSFNDKDSCINSIADLYCKTFIGNYYSLDEHKATVYNITKHASYKGFKGLVAKDDNRTLLGFAYGYTSLPDQFYRKKLEEQLTIQQSNVWLNDCFEFVELAVNPMFKREGIGSLLHDRLLEDLGHRTSVLTTSMDNVAAINLYQNKGWDVIKENAVMIAATDSQVIMGKKIN